VPIAYTPTGDPFFYGQEAFSGPAPPAYPPTFGAPGTGAPGSGGTAAAPKGTPAWLQQIVQQALGMGDATARQAREQHILSSGLPAGTLPWVQQMFGQQTPVAQTAARVPPTQTGLNLNWY